MGYNFGILTHARRNGRSAGYYEPFDSGIILGIKFDINRYTLSFYRIQEIKDVTWAIRQNYQ